MVINSKVDAENLQFYKNEKNNQYKLAIKAIN
jgi:hypothetical protein